MEQTNSIPMEHVNSEELKKFMNTDLLAGIGGTTTATGKKGEKWSDYIVGYDEIKKTPRPEPLVKRGDVVMIYKHALTVVAAPAKTGKTSFVAMCLFGDPEPLGRVIWIDGEQQAVDRRMTYETLQYYSRSAEEIDGLTYLKFLEPDRAKRLPFAIDAIHDAKPDVVVIDGLQQLIQGDDKEITATEVVDPILTAIDDVGATAIVIVQTSRTSGLNGEPSIKGHLGSIAQERSVNVFYLSKDEETKNVTVKLKMSRRQEDGAEFLLTRDMTGRLQWSDTPSSISAFRPDTHKVEQLRKIAEMYGGEIRNKDVKSQLDISTFAANRLLTQYSDTKFVPDVRKPLRKYGDKKGTYYIFKDVLSSEK